MTAVLNVVGTLERHSRFPNRPERTPLREQFGVAGVVVLLHISVFASYLLQPEEPAVINNEMSISFTNMQLQQADAAPQPKPKLRDPDPTPSDEPAPKEEVQPVKQDSSPPSPVVLDDEPVFHADYLNNPKPSYPMVAKRMGYQGMVMLDVEVLAEGKAGEVKVDKSSGYDILDKAALLTVKTWRFTPAHRFGQPITQWVKVPVKFNLEDNEA